MSLQGFLERTPFISRSLLVKMGCILKDFFSLIIQPSLFQRVLWHMFIIFVWLHFLWLKRSPIWKEDTYALFLFLEIEGILKTWLMEHVRNANFLALPQTYWITSSGLGSVCSSGFTSPPGDSDPHSRLRASGLTSPFLTFFLLPGGCAVPLSGCWQVEPLT